MTNFAPKVTHSLRSANSGAVHAFERYGHIIFFAQVFIDHGESPYGMVCIGLAGLFSVACVVCRKLED